MDEKLTPTESRVLTIDEIREAIEIGDPELFIGVEETAYFEVRSRSYMTQHEDKIQKEKGKQTLVFDISSIANSGGGYLLLGFDTLQNLESQREYVSKVSGISAPTINIELWRQVLQEYTVPVLPMQEIVSGFIESDSGLVYWMKIPSSKSLGIYPILVKKQKWEIDKFSLLNGFNVRTLS